MFRGHTKKHVFENTARIKNLGFVSCNQKNRAMDLLGDCHVVVVQTRQLLGLSRGGHLESPNTK